MHVPMKTSQSGQPPKPTTVRLSTQLKYVCQLQGNNGTNFRNSAVRQFVAQHVFERPQINHVFNEITGRRETLKTLLSGNQKETWTTSLANEWGRLANRM